MVSALNCTEAPAGDLSTRGTENPERVRALVDHCAAFLKRNKVGFDLAVLPLRNPSQLATAVGLPPTLVHNVQYARSIAALYAQIQSARAGVAASQSGMSAFTSSATAIDRVDTLLSAATPAAVAGMCLKRG